tara:strand:+ start:526 stop:1023 length:498 start_codon:yes stop_codon:yes gene_type:complete
MPSAVAQALGQEVLNGMLKPWEMKMRPRFLLSLGGTHDFPHTAFKDIAANAKDAGSPTFAIDATMIGGVMALTTSDTGRGPVDCASGKVTIDSFLEQLFDLGATTASANHLAAGQFGSGAVTAPLGLLEHRGRHTLGQALLRCPALALGPCRERHARDEAAVPHL